MKGKRVATNSMMATAKRCREKFALRYVDGLVPARSSRAPSFGSLFHLLMRAFWLDSSMTDAIETWRNERVSDAQNQAEQVKAQLGFDDPGIVSDVEQQCDEIISEVRELFEYHRDTVLVHERSRFEPLFVEQDFNVPLVTRDDKRHPVWRFAGKWDLVLLDNHTGRTLVRDYKTTVRQPTDFAMMCELDTQPIGYFFAALYLATLPRDELTREQINRARKLADCSIEPDLPFWPSDVPHPLDYELDIVRKKVPREPKPLKSGKALSKAQGIDTTPELYRAAIDRHGFDVADYEDVLERLQKRGPVFHYRHRVSVGADEIRRWVHETRLCLEDCREIELHRDRTYRADPMTCQNQYGRRCQYHAICFGDSQMARADFIVKPRHDELDEPPEEEENGGSS